MRNCAHLLLYFRKKSNEVAKEHPNQLKEVVAAVASVRVGAVVAPPVVPEAIPVADFSAKKMVGFAATADSKEDALENAGKV